MPSSSTHVHHFRVTLSAELNCAPYIYNRRTTRAEYALSLTSMTQTLLLPLASFVCSRTSPTFAKNISSTPWLCAVTGSRSYPGRENQSTLAHSLLHSNEITVFPPNRKLVSVPYFKSIGNTLGFHIHGYHLSSKSLSLTKHTNARTRGIRIQINPRRSCSKPTTVKANSRETEFSPPEARQCLYTRCLIPKRQDS